MMATRLPWILAGFTFVWHSMEVAWAIDPSEVVPGRAYVLLESGKVLHGDVSVSGQDISIEDSSAKIVKKSTDVRKIAPDLMGLYQFQTRVVSRWDTAQHLHFARWCMENNLLDLAGEHYLELRKRIPNDPKFRRIDQELRQKLLEDPQSRIAFGLGPKIPNKVNEKGEVSLASATSSDLQIAPGVAVEYRESILPILRNRCGQTACHGLQGKTDLLFPPSTTQAFATFQKSLEGAVRSVRKEDPANSPLLKMAMQAHSLQTKPSFDPGNPNDLQYLSRMESWVRNVAASGVTTAGMYPAYFPQANAAPAVPQQNPIATAVPMIPAGTTGRERIETSDLKMLEEAIRSLEKIEKARETRDPFDPESFNSRARTAVESSPGTVR